MFIVFEGIEGVGKSTIVKKLGEKLEKNNIKVKVTSEPTGYNNQFGQDIRKLIMKEDTLPLTEFLLFSSFRNEHVNKYIKKWLNEGNIVLCDRFIYSSIVYQGYLQEVNLDYIHKTNEIILDGLKIDKVFLIDLNPEIAQQRMKDSKRIYDKFDQKNMDFHIKIRDIYHQLAKEHNFEIIDNGQEVEKIVDVLYQKIILL